MKLEKIKIKSFRSVINQEIDIDFNCIGFIGLNEAGKTNVLNAIRSLNKNYKLSIKDKSKIDGSLPEVEFDFVLTPSETSKLLKSYNEKILKERSLEGSEQVIKEIEVENVTIRRDLRIEEKDYISILTPTFDCKVVVNDDFLFLKEENDIPDKAEVSIGQHDYQLNLLKVIHKKDIPGEYKDSYSSILEASIASEIEKYIASFLLKNKPYVQYWEYKDQYLLPAEIKYEEFMKDGDPYLNTAPLYNSFVISEDLEINNEEDLENKIVEWKGDSSSRRKDSNILSRDINKHIKKIWQDYDQELRIELEETKITIHVSDPKSSKMNFYDMGLRSQGFKTFISFILTVSAEAKSGILEDFILILDEPETHLHPSGVKYMREELFKLAEANNKVFFATHSIFMIDRTNLKRHIIIKKENELTKLSKVSRNNILQEEIIYNALGTSLDEFSIAGYNVVFEGELDLKLFSFYIEKCIEKKKNIFNDYEFLDGGGTKRILEFFKTRSLPKNSKWILILDNDSAGRELPTNINKVVSESIKDNIKAYYYSETTDYELEDILPKEQIRSSFEQAKSSVEFEENIEIDIDQERPVSKATGEFYGRNKITSDSKNLVEENFKSALEQVVLAALGEIAKETSIEKRRNKFAEVLPDYFSFVERVMGTFPTEQFNIHS